jgi:hypothetical protein
MEVTRIADLPPKLIEVAGNPVDPDFVNAFTKIQDPFPKGSAGGAGPPVRRSSPTMPDDYY